MDNLCRELRRFRPTGQIADRNADGTVVADPEQAIPIYFDFWGGLAKDPSRLTREEWEARCPLERRPELEGLSGWFDQEEVLTALRGTQAGTAGGLDGLPPELLKAAQRTRSFGGVRSHGPLLGALTRLANSLFGASQLTADLLTAMICPIHNGKSDPTMPANTRPISLLPVTLKLVSKMVADRLGKAMESVGFFAREQGGFREGEEAVAQVAALLEVI